MNAEKTRVSGVQLAAYQASSFERFTQINNRGWLANSRPLLAINYAN